ncbi:hypothetical protein QQF64_022304 [Cirrhinus molitorella]|uniref:Uncharacterized protein n=1 Tax=Cirrhinus molitorella TaxID=172907 RepID=A0ABR3LA58_9TELE
MVSSTLKQGREKDQERTRNKKGVQLANRRLVEKFPPDGWLWRFSKEEIVTFFLKPCCDSTGWSSEIQPNRELRL